MFLTALYFLLASIALFVVHLILLARYEQKSVAKEAALSPDVATA